LFGGAVDMAGRVSVRESRFAVDADTEAIKDDTVPAPLRRETPQAHDGLLVHGKGVLFSARKVVEVLQSRARAVALTSL
jgi:hypothetical protein